MNEDDCKESDGISDVQIIMNLMSLGQNDINSKFV